MTTMTRRQRAQVESKRQRKAPKPRQLTRRQQRYAELGVDVENLWAPFMFAEKKTRGFKNNARKIARKQGISMKKASAILAASTRKASPAAKRRNPRLRRVK